MATRKEQLDALVFARRRMISNLLQPSPTGSDDAAPRPFRSLTGSISIALALLLLMLVLGIGHSSASGDWMDGKNLLIDKAGTRYIVSDRQAHPVLNTTSADLLLGHGTAGSPDQITDAKLATLGKPMGKPVGIQAAPDYLPPSGNLNLTRWTACSEPVGTSQTQQSALEIGYGPRASAMLGTTDGLLATDDYYGTTYLLANGQKFPFQGSPTEQQNILSALSVVSHAPPASSLWLRALPTGQPITLPSLLHHGDPVRGQAPAGMDRIGDYGTLTLQNGAVQDFVETDQGLVTVSPFTYALFRFSGSKTGAPQDLQLGFDQNEPPKDATGSSVDASVGTLGNSSWPTNQLTIMNGANDTTTSTLCATYSGNHTGKNAQFVLSAGAALPQRIPGNDAVTPSATTATGNLAGVVYVKPGSGVIAAPIDGPIAQQPSHDTSGNGPKTIAPEQFLITDTGFSYKLLTESAAGGSAISAASQLGYGGVKPFPVPMALLAMVQSGPNLGVDEAQVGQDQTGNE